MLTGGGRCREPDAESLVHMLTRAESLVIALRRCYELAVFAINPFRAIALTGR